MQLVTESNIPNLGYGFINRNIFSDLKTEYDLISILKQDETILLIGKYETQSARYSLYDLPIPSISHSILNIPSLYSESQELEKIKKKNIPLIRIDSGFNRHFLLHDYVLSLGYEMISFGNHNYLVSKDFIARLNENYLKYELIDYSKLFSTKEFSLLPIKWGTALSQEIDNLAKVASTAKIVSSNHYDVGNGKVSGLDPYVVFQFKTEINEKISLINFNIEKSEDDICRGQLFWSDSLTFTEDKSVRFHFGNGNNVLPLHMNRLWKNPSYLRFDFDTCSEEKIAVKTIDAYQYDYK